MAYWNEEAEKLIASILIATALFVGLMFPQFAEQLYAHIFVWLLLLIIFSLCALQDGILHVLGFLDRFTVLTIGWQMVALPLIVTIGCIVMETSPMLTTILVTSTTSGAVFASPALAQILGLNAAIAARAMLISTLLMPVSLVAFGKLNGILPRDMNFEIYAEQLVIFIVIPFTISLLHSSIQRTKATEEERIQRRKWMQRFSTLAVMGFACGMMHVIDERKSMMWTDLAEYVTIACALAFFTMVLTFLVFQKFGREQALIAAILSSNRNVALSFALMSAVFPAQIVLYIAAAQFPIFLAPIILRGFTGIQQWLRPSAATA